MKSLRFWKVQSIGNDFPLVHLSDVPGEQLNDLAIATCDRRFGIGGDGLLAIGPESDAIRLRMFNPDGTEDFCGNGLRCAAMHAVEMGWVEGEFIQRHLDRDVISRVTPEGITTVLGSATYDPAKVPTSLNDELFRRPIMVDGRELVVSSLTTGSTHTIVPVPELPRDTEFERLGPLLEHHPAFPERTSVIWTQAVGANHLKVRIWERGVGETQGCGTGSSAAAADYLRFTKGSGQVRVDNPGGTVFATMETWQAPISLVGQAQTVFEGFFPWG